MENTVSMAKTKDGLPRKSFAYAPTADPASWKLPYKTADGKPDPDHLPGAAAAVGEGFRGQKADIPDNAVAAVKARLRAAYRAWKGSDVEYPAGIKETRITGEDGVELREAVVLLDKGCTYAKVIFAPNGDAYVVPDYDGAFYYGSQPWMAPDGGTDYMSAYNAQDASRMIGSLAVMKQNEKDEPEDAAALDAAIGALQTFVKNETAEIGAEPAATAESVAAAIDTIEAASAWVAAAPAELREAGRRNSKTDQMRIQGMHDLAHDLGATHDKGKSYAGMAESGPTAPARVEHLVETTNAAGATVEFRESTYDSAVIVDLREADPQWTEDGKSVWITPIRPGFGNERDNFFYPADTLREATESGLFNGLKMYKDHPSATQKKDLPERSVERWFATTKESSWDPNRQMPRVLVTVHDESDRNRFHDAPEQIAFSIIGGGHARPGRVDGKDTRVVESFHHVASVDWVTEAGAGGALDFAESAASEEQDMDLSKISAAELKAANPALYASIVSEGAEPAKTDTEPDEKVEKTEAVAESGPPEWAKGLIEFVSESKAEKAEAAKSAQLAASKPAAAQVVEATIAESTLIGPVKAFVKAQFADSTIGEGGTHADGEALKASVAEALTSAGALASAIGGKPAGVKGLGGSGTPDPKDGVTVTESALADLGKSWGSTDAPPKPKLVYDTGDDLSDVGRTPERGATALDGAITESGAASQTTPPDDLAAAFKGASSAAAS